MIAEVHEDYEIGARREDEQTAHSPDGSGPPVALLFARPHHHCLQGLSRLGMVSCCAIGKTGDGRPYALRVALPSMLPR